MDWRPSGELDVEHELALAVAPLGFDIRAAHLWSQHNKICDHLSRIQSTEPHNTEQLNAATRSVRVATMGDILHSKQKGMPSGRCLGAARL